MATFKKAVGVLCAFITIVCIFCSLEWRMEKAAATTEKTYPTQYYEMDKKQEDSNRWTSYVYFTGGNKIEANASSSFSLGGELISRQLSGIAYASAIAFTAPTAGTLKTAGNAKLEFKEAKAKTSFVFFKGILGESGTICEGLSPVFSYSFEEKQVTAINFYDKVYSALDTQGELTFKAGESLILLLIAEEGAQYNEAAMKISSMRLYFKADGEENKTEYSLKMPANNDDSAFKETGKSSFSIEKWLMENPTFSFHVARIPAQPKQILDLNTAKDFGKITMASESEMPWESKASNGTGGWKAQQEVYVAPRNTTVDATTGKGKTMMMHTYSLGGKSVAYCFTAPEDMTAQITNLYLYKSSLKQNELQGNVITGADGIEYAVIYYSKETNKYYSVLEEKWTTFKAEYEVDVELNRTDIPAVNMKKDDKLMVAFGNKENKIMDFITHSYVNLEATYANGISESLNMMDDFTFIKEGDSVTAFDRDNSVGNWSITYIRIASDYSSVIVSDAVVGEYLSVGNITEEELSFNKVQKEYVAVGNADGKIKFSGTDVTVCPGEENPVAFRLKIGKTGKALIHEDSFLKFENDGSSNGIRFRILKNDEIIYPANGGWMNVRDNATFSLSGIDVFRITEYDNLYFVFDCFGDTTMDTTKVDFVILFAPQDGAETEVFHLADNIVLHERDSDSRQNLEGWAYLSLHLENDPNSGIILGKIGREEGCRSSLSLNVVLMTTLTCTVCITARRKKDEKPD